MVWKDLPLIDSVESMERDRETKLSTRGGMMADFSVRNTTNIMRALCIFRFLMSDDVAMQR